MATEGRNIAIYGETPDGLEDDGSLEQERLLAVPMVVAAVMARMVVAAVRTCPRRSRHPSQVVQPSHKKLHTRGKGLTKHHQEIAECFNRRGELSCGLDGDVGAVQEACWARPFQGSEPGQARQGRGSMEGVHDSGSTRKNPLCAAELCAPFPNMAPGSPIRVAAGRVVMDDNEATVPLI
uniref:Uncharacterized protein n=1 Tax=Aegilops tauschii TaxID=37682 RepID=M8BE47_AEGTA